MAEAAPTPPKKPAPPTFAELWRGKLTPAELAALRRVRWFDRLTSLWAPVTVLALVFLVYLVIVESLVCSYPWLLPPMQAFGALCFFWWAGLVIWGRAARMASRRRKARTFAEELLVDVQRVVKRHRAAIKDKATNELVEGAAALVRALTKDQAAIEAATKELDTSADKHLATLRKVSLLDAGGGFAKALLIALLVRSVFVEPFKIPSGSMLPTLEIGDQIFVNKFIYGVRVPFTNWVPFVVVRPPKRGDVIVFNNPVRPEVDYIKRVVGVPGDRVSFRGRAVFVNDVELSVQPEAEGFVTWEQPTPASFTDWVLNWRNWFVNDWFTNTQSLGRETIDGQAHWVLHDDTHPNRISGEIAVPQGHVFVMGDNRDNSTDSRFGLGGPDRGVKFVPWGSIKGKATVIWLALGHDGLFSGVFGGTGIRTDRFFRPVSLCGNEPTRTR